jgi:tol-pal system protein YbgF
MRVRQRCALLLPGAVLTLASVGCIMPDQVAKLEKDMADVRARLARMEQTQAAAQQAVDEVNRKLGDSSSTVSREDFGDLESRVSQIREGLSTNGQQMADLGRRVDQLSVEVRDRGAARVPPPPTYTQPTEPGAAPAPAGDAGAAAALPDPQSLYNTAYADYSKGNYALAISGFEEYRTKFPTSPLADNAMYWIGECQFSQGAFPEAIAAFDRLLAAHPDSEKAAAANLKKGLAFLEQNDVRRAIVQLRYVVSEYPQSDEAKIARDKLTSLGATT